MQCSLFTVFFSLYLLVLKCSGPFFCSFAVLYNGVCHLLCPLAESYTGLVVYAVFFGFAFGMVSSVLFETLMDLVGPQRFSSAVGLTTIVECCPVLIGPPLAGTSHVPFSYWSTACSHGHLSLEVALLKITLFDRMLFAFARLKSVYQLSYQYREIVTYKDLK